MREAERAEELGELIHAARNEGKSIGFVPTMGYLHEGHVSLLTEARRESDLVVLSIYVNPAQFGAGEDLVHYPRQLERDREIARASGVDLLFLPSDEEMYPNGLEGQALWVDPGELGERLEGASRPGHFRGVATIVAKLFNTVEPDRAYFGQKDAQQAVIIRRMVRDLAFRVEIRLLPTIREPDGLALSSRNSYLSAEERRQALALYKALSWVESAVRERRLDAREVEAEVARIINREAPAGRIDYVAVVNPETLEPIEGGVDPGALVALAVYFGRARLIDNLLVDSR